MGSPSARLKTREELRPWVESGLEFVYQPGGAAQQAVPPASLATPVPDQPASVPQPAAQPPQAEGHSGFAPARQSAQQDFPAPWSGFLKFAKPAPKIVWTYMELGLDLGGQSDPRRSDVLRNLQTHLRWPQGTINFWPVSALMSGTLQPDGGMFWKGWELWRTPVIACFGEEALKVILPDGDPSLTTHLLEHVTVHVLPPLARLVTMLPHEQQMAVDVLANIRL